MAQSSIEERIFRESSADFIKSTASIAHSRKQWRQSAPLDRSWWKDASELGWASLLVPPELGGGAVSGEGVRDLCAVAKELGKNVSFGPLQPVNIVLSGLILAEPLSPAIAQVVEDLLAGEAVATWCVIGPRQKWGSWGDGLTSRKESGNYVLDGTKALAEAAGESDWLLVTAEADSDGIVQLLVPSNAPGVTITRQHSIDAVRSFSEIEFSGVEVGSEYVVSGPEHTNRLLQRQSQIALVLQLSETMGLLTTVFDFTLKWMFDRYSFGRSLASYQALKHRMADLRLWLEAADSTVSAAISAVQADSEDAALLTSVAKSYVGDRSVQILQECVQIHGGIGVTTEHDLHLYLRRAIVNRGLYGTPREHRLHVATLNGM